MKNNLSLNKNFALSKNLVKIGDASKQVGVSIDTLRRWEKKGLINPVRTEGGTRLYSLTELEQIKISSGKANSGNNSQKLDQNTNLSNQTVSPSNFIKIGEAANTLGVSIDTLRRWETTGKLKSLRTEGGTRLYSIEQISKIKSKKETTASTPNPFSTEELLKKLQQQPYSQPIIRIEPTVEASKKYPQNISKGITKTLTSFMIRSSIFTSLFSLLVTGWIVASYVYQPQSANQFFKENIAASILKPFNKIAQQTFALINPAEAKGIGISSVFLPPDIPPPLVLQQDDINRAVLAVTSASRFLEINSDTQINGALFVRDAINNVALEGTPSASTITLSSGDTNLNITNTSTIDQDLATVASPTFASLNLSGTTNQLIFQSGGPTGTLTWTPTADRIITLPDATTTLVGIDNAQTITNKTISGSSNTITNIPASALTDAKITINAGANLSGGGEAALGSSVTLALKDSPTIAGTLTVTGPTVLSSTLAVSGATTLSGAAALSSTLAVTGATTLSSTLAVTGATTLSSASLSIAGVSYTFPTSQGASGTALVEDGAGNLSWTSLSAASGWTVSGINVYNTNTTGNVGVGATTSSNKLDVWGNAFITGNVGVGQSLSVTSATALSTLNVTGLSNLSSVNATDINSATLTTTGNVGVGGSLTVTSASLLDSLQVTKSISGATLGISGISNLGVVNTGALTSTTINASSLTTTGNVGIGGSLSVTSATSLSTLNVSGLSNLANVNASTINAASLSTTGNVGVGGSITGFGALNGLNVTGLSNLATLNATDINSSTLTTSGNVGVGSSLTTTGLGVFNGGLYASYIQTPSLTASSLTTTGNLGVGGSLTVTSAGVFSSGINVAGSGSFGSLGVTGVSSLGVVNTGALTSTTINASSLTTTGNVGVGGSITGFGALSGLNVTGLSNLSSVNATDINSATLTTTGNVGVGTSLTVTSASLLDSLQVTKSISGATLGISGISNLGVVNATTLTTTGNVGVGGSLTVTSAGVFSSGINVTGSANLSTLFTTGNTGIGGSLNVTSNATLGSLTVSGLSSLGNVNTGTLNSTTINASSLTTTGNVGVGGSLSVTSATALSTLNVTGLSNLSSVNATDINSATLTTTGNVGVGGSITGFGALNGLNVTGLSNLAALNATNINSSTLTTTGNVGVGSSLTVTSASLLDSLQVTKSISGATLGISGVSSLGVVNTGALTSTTINANSLTTTGNVGVGGSLSVTSAAALSTLNVTGLSNLANVNASAINATTLTTTGNVAIGGSLTVSSAPVFSTLGAGLVFSNSSGGLSSGLLNLSSGSSFFSGILPIANGGTNASSFNTGGITYYNGTRLADSAANFFFDSTNNRLGIGNSNPQYALDVTGTGYFSGFVGIGSSLNVAGNVGVGTSLTVTSASLLDSLQVTKSISGATLGISGVSSLGVINASSLTTTGNVGIGGSLTVTSTTALSTLNVTGLSNLSTVNASTINSSSLTLTGANSALSFTGSTPSITSGSSLFGIFAGGNVGIGTTSTLGSSFNVNGNQVIGSSFIGGAAPTNGLAIEGNVGIGTTSVDYNLKVLGTGFFSGFVGIGSSLNVAGNVGVGTSLTVTSASLLDSLQVTKSISGATLGISGVSSLGVINASSLTTTGNVGVGGSLTVTSASLLDSLQVTKSISGATLGISGTSNLGVVNTGALTSTTINASSLTTTGNITSGGVFLAADGTASAPGYAFTNDTNSGLWRIGADQIALTTAGGSHSGLSVNSSGNVGIGTTAAVSQVEIKASQTSGTVFNLNYKAGTTLTGALTGVSVDLNDGNVTPTNQDVTALVVKLPTTTNTNSSGTVNLRGLYSSFGAGAGINQNGAGATIYSAAEFTLPALTQTSGTVTANGLLVNTPAGITTGGTANGININATGVGAGALNGINIGTITGGSGTEIALNIGSGWDTVLKVGSTTIINGSGVTQVAGGGTGIASYSSGDILYASGATTFTNLGIGSSGQVLTVTAGVPVWSTINGSSCSTCLINNPSSSAVNTIAPTGQATTGLIVKQTSTGSPTSDIFQITDSAGSTKYFYVDKDGNVSTGAIANTTLTLTPTSDTTALTLNGTNVATSKLSYYNAANTSGTIFDISYGSPVLLTGSLTGQSINLGIGATNQSVTGTAITLPSTTNTGASTYNLRGVTVSGAGGINNTGSGTTNFYGIDVSVPALTQTSGTVNGYGINVTTPSSITTGGTAAGLNVNSTGTSVGTLYGVNIGSITAGAGAERAVNIGTGWDFGIFSQTTSPSYFEGNLGIGTSITSYKLDVSGTANVSGNVGIGSTLTVTSAGIFNSSIQVSGSTNLSTLNVSGLSNLNNVFTSGNVGIGATSSDNKLDVWGDARITGTLTVDGDFSLGGTSSGSQFLANDGSISSPGYSFTNDTNTGIFRPGTDALGFTTGGTSRLTITAAGNVGIGTTSPSFQLQTTGNVDIGGSLTIGQTVTAGSQFLGANGTASAPSHSFTNSASTGLWSPVANSLSLTTNGSATGGLNINSAGNIGIGLTTQSAKVEVNGSMNIFGDIVFCASSPCSTAADTDNITKVSTNTMGTGARWAVGGGTVGAPALSSTGDLDTGLLWDNANALDLVGGGVRRIRIDANGNVGIGATTAVVKLGVSGNVAIGSNFGWATAPTNGLAIEGNVGIGTTTANYNLQVVGTGYFSGFVGIGSSLNVAGNVGVGTSLTVTSASLLDSLQVTKSISGATLGISGVSSLGVINATSLTTTGNITSGGVFLASDGTAAAPGLSFTNDTNTGLWRIGTDQIALTTAGNAMSGLSVNSSGNVGIGNTSGSVKLHVNAGNTPAGSLEALRLEVTGNEAVGRGPFISFYAPNNSGSSRQVATIAGLNDGGSLNSGRLVFSTEDSSNVLQERMRIDSSGNVGIGTSNPGSTLAVSGNAVFGFGGTTSIAGPTNGLAVSGNVGIGTTSANSALEVVGAGAFGDGSASLPALTFRADTNTGIFRPGTDALGLSTGGTSRLTVTAAGNVGIGLTNPDQALDVSGDLGVSGDLQMYWNSDITFHPSGGSGFQIATTSNSFALNDTYKTVFTITDSSSAGIDDVFAISGAKVAIDYANIPGAALAVNGNVGIGTSTANAALHINGAGLIGYAGTVGGAPSSGLAISGNVGIGTTTANNKLSVVGGVNISNNYQSIIVPTSGLFVEGNVGIGASTSTNKLDVWGNARVTGTLTVDGATTIGGTITPTGQFLAQDGTASLPGYSFSNDTDSGLWRVGTNSVALTVNGTAASGITINASGNVGLGTSAPGAAIDANGNMIVRGTFTQIVSGAPQLTIDTSGNISDGSGNLVFDDGITINADNSMAFGGGTGNLTIGSYTGFNNAIGIGVSNPSQLNNAAGLSVVNNATITGSNKRTFGVFSSVTGNGSSQTNYGGYFSAVNGGTANYGLVVESGNVGIGTTTPFAKLQLQGTGTSTGLNFLTTASNGTQGLAVLDNGNVGIGTTAPVNKLDISGAAAIGSYAGGNTTAPSNGLIVSGNVGIGNSIPGGLLELGTRPSLGSALPGFRVAINSQTSSGDTLLLTNGDDVNRTTSIQFRGSPIADIASYSAARIISGVSGGNFNTTYLTLGSASAANTFRNELTLYGGNVGIGNTFPTALLHVGSSATAPVLYAQSGGNLGVGIASPTNKFQVSGGNVGIGVTTAVSTLAVNGNSTIGWGLTGIAGPTNGLAVSGNVGIGTTTPNYNLEVAGTGYFSGFVGIGSSLNVAGNVGIGTSLTVTSASLLDSLQVTKSISGATLGISGVSSLGVINATSLTTTGNITSAGVFLAADGTAAAPGYSFTADTDTGIFRAGTNILSLTTGGTSRVNIDASGNLGIGATTPVAKLGVSGNAAIGSNYGWLTAPTSGLIVEGNVGIGNSAPSARLSVNLPSQLAADVPLARFDGTSGRFTGTTVGMIDLLGYDNDATTTVLRVVDENSLTDLTLTNTGDGGTTGANLYVRGNIGIGATTSANKLDVWGNARVTGTLTVDGATTIGGTITPTGQFLAQDGTASLPGYSFTNDTNTGIFRAGTDALGFATGGTSQLTITAAGNVGIGTTSPATLFEVNGRARVNSLQIIGDGSTAKIGTTGSSVFQLYSDINFSNTANLNIGAGSVGFSYGLVLPSNGLAVSGNIGIGTTTANNKLSVVGGVNISNNFQSFTAPTSGLFVEGNVGIGITTSLNKLDVNGNTRVFGNLTVDGTTTSTSALQLANGTAAAPSLSFSNDTDSGLWRVGTNSVALTVNGTAASGITINASGNVGLGTSAPGAAIDANGNMIVRGTFTQIVSGAPQLTIDTSGNISDGSGNLVLNDAITIGANNTMTFAAGTGALALTSYIGSTNAIGIGVSNPAQLNNAAGLNITNQATISGSNKRTFGIFATTTGTGASQTNYGGYFSAVNGGTANYGLVVESGNVGIGITNPAQLLQINGSTADTFVVTSGGNVGIGTSTPGAKLHVVDDAQPRIPAGASIAYFGSTDGTTTGVSIRALGSVLSATADFGEYFSFTGQGQDYEDGDLVSLSTVGGATVEKTSNPYDQSIRGIVTKASAFIAGADEGTEYNEAGHPTNRVAVALLGRVPLKVSTENGPIKVGDFLTSSSTPGVAMKALRPGQVVGKALEDYDNPDPHQWGKVLTFVSASFADPNNFFSSLSMDDDGNLIMPKVKVGSLVLDESLATSSAQLSVNNNQLAINSDPDYTSTSVNTQMSSNSVDIGGKIASIEQVLQEQKDKFDLQESKFKSLEERLALLEATSSGQVTGNSLQEASNSATTSSSLADNCQLTTDNCKLDLTPPDILLASGSAKLASIQIQSDATVSGMLTAYQAQIKDNFKVLGNTILGKTSVAGNLNVDGTLSIENGSEINVIGTLYLQKSLLAQKLDIFNGKVTIDKEGNFQAKTVIADQIKVSKGKAAGTGKIPVGQTEAIIENPFVDENSIIVLTPNTPLQQTLAVVEKIKETGTVNASFKVKLSKPEIVEVKFDYIIVGIEPTPAPITQATP